MDLGGDFGYNHVNTKIKIMKFDIISFFFNKDLVFGE